ncbi:MAG: S9 family peptidase [Anaerolineaceae bacterium]|nr:S9 family peptidase [Anaerolineaceae bacterium]
MKEKKEKPFGLWDSSITALSISQGIRLNDVQWDTDGETLVWLEGRSDIGMLVANRKFEAGTDLNGEISCKGGVGYGGGEFSVRNHLVVFAGKDGRLYRRELDPQTPRALTPAYGWVAAPQISPDEKYVVYIFSDGENDALGVVDSEGVNWPQKIVQGADFYMQPVWHPDGRMLAWIEWDHPNMPWDGTRLKMASLEFNQLPVVNQIQTIVGDEDTIIFQPEFSPDGCWLSYLTSDGEWDAFVLVNLSSMEKQVVYRPGGLHLMEPAWVQGLRTYGWSADSRSIYLLQNQSGFGSLWKLDISSKEAKKIDTGEYTWLNQISVSTSGQVALIATSASIPPRIIVGDGMSWRVAARSSAENIPASFLSTPQAISWPAQEGTTIHGLYYPPANPNFFREGKPPAVVYIHGGPTSQVRAGYSATTAFFTSRGYGWLDVNYRGSTGYGHSYKNLLRGRWGDVDVEDAVGGARALIEAGFVNEKQLVILGGSAGGYTVLNSLIRYPGVFKAGICNYGVSNLFMLDMDTHKFEAHYNASLIGKLPEAAEKYHAWSPVFHADKIRDALAVFQGAEDNVVLPNQSEVIVEKLRRQGVPFIYQLYEGEGHGFRKNTTLLDYYQRVERFLIENVLFAP